MAEDLLSKIVSLAKRRGFVFPGSEIYGGLSGTWDFGPVGTELKNNIKNAWWKMFVQERNDMYGLDSAILMNAKVWKASGHVEGFVDPMVDCRSCKSRFRADHLKEGKYGEVKIIEGKQACPICGKTELTGARKFNMMFKTFIGPMEETASEIYLRPENAQGMFVDFKSVLDTMHPKLPFGIAQAGRAFRNEITPGDFIFRVREFDLMELEYFINPKDWNKLFEAWVLEIAKWLNFLGLDSKKIYYREIPDGERAHYSKRTVDVEYQFPFGKKELCAIAYRTDYDLKQHQEYSGKDLTYFDEKTGNRFIPHVLEPTFGLDRALLAVLTEAYTEKGERVYLRIPAKLAPYKAAVFPLLANKPGLVKLARKIYDDLRKDFMIAWDDRGNIGKRYYAQDEIGTPYCITIDFDSLKKKDVTIRDRDTMKQKRVKIKELKTTIDNILFE
ncbi:MAG: glycine--tRNA ligase [Candidatus Nealsonbacteria bacterium]|nr:glycine--tRNA ligase [Candidatus Nealsonbacteria bacterium]